MIKIEKEAAHEMEDFRQEYPPFYGTISLTNNNSQNSPLLAHKKDKGSFSPIGPAPSLNNGANVQVFRTRVVYNEDAENKSQEASV